MTIPTALDISLIVNFVLFISFLAELINHKADIANRSKFFALKKRNKKLESTIREMTDRVNEIHQQRIKFDDESE